MATPAARRPLADAICARDVAARNLDDARSAHEKAEQTVWAEAAELRRLQAELDRPDDDNALIAAVQAGDIGLVDRPRLELRASIERLEQSLAGWRRARDAAQAQIEPREAELARAEAAVEELARRALLAEIDVEALLVAAEEAQRALAGQRIQLAFLSSLGGEHAAQIDRFLGTPAFLDELRGASGDYPVTAGMRDALAGLKASASFKIEGMP